MRLQLVFLSIMFFTVNCSGRKGMDDEGSEKTRACKKISEDTKREKYPLVQPPALATVSTTVRFPPKLNISTKSDLVVGLNVKAIKKLPLWDDIISNYPSLNSYINYGSAMGLEPGKGVQSIIFGIQSGKRFFKLIDDYSAVIMGEMNAANILERLKSMAGLVSGYGVELSEPENKDSIFKLNYKGISLSAGHNGADIINLYASEKTEKNISSDKAFSEMKKNIPNDTTFWIIMLSRPVLPWTLPRVFAPIYKNVMNFSGYINSDEHGNIECQIRVRMADENAARQLKELATLGMSRVIQKLGPRIGRTVTLDNNGLSKNIVSRGAFVRLLFRFDRYQANYVMNFIKKHLIVNTHWIKKANTAIN
ncbi:MAG: hypothetical protein JXR95_03610 [Deltaproteobacteria bacterium]|nr:hypothetical protein [Deltaproteobacteria bacterium]